MADKSIGTARSLAIRFGLCGELTESDRQCEKLGDLIQHVIDKARAWEGEPPKDTIQTQGYDGEGKRVVTCSTTSFAPQEEHAAMHAALELRRAALMRGVDITPEMLYRHVFGKAYANGQTDAALASIKVNRNQAGQLSLVYADGEPFDMSRHVGQTFYAPTAPAAGPYSGITPMEQRAVMATPAAGPQQGEAVAWNTLAKFGRVDKLPFRDRYTDKVAPCECVILTRQDVQQLNQSRPAPAVERGVAEAWLLAEAGGQIAHMLEDLVTVTIDGAGLRRFVPQQSLLFSNFALAMEGWLSRARAALTATGAAQGDGASDALAASIRRMESATANLTNPDTSDLDPELLAYARSTIAQQEAPAAQPLTEAARDVLAERQRQIEVEGWTPEHDDEHAHGALSRASASYALASAALLSAHPGVIQWTTEAAMQAWPWSADWWKPTDPRRMLVKATALGLAEIERWDRAHGIQPAATKGVT